MYRDLNPTPKKHSSCRTSRGGLRGLRIGMLEGNSDDGYIALGAGIGAIHAVRLVADVIDKLMLGIE